MINYTTVLAIIVMASVTYFTRVIGYVGLQNRTLSPRLAPVLEAALGCVLISVIAPHFVSSHPADLIALAITIIAAMRLSMFQTVMIGVISAGVLRYLLP